MVKHWYKSQQCCTFKNRDNINYYDLTSQHIVYYSMAHEAMCYFIQREVREYHSIAREAVYLYSIEYYSIAKCSDKA